MKKQKAQSRRSVSISGDLFKALKSYVGKHKTSMSEAIEERMRDFLGMKPRAKAVPVAAKKPEKKKPVKVQKKEPPKATVVETVKETKRFVRPLKNIPKMAVVEDQVRETVSEKFTGAPSIMFL